MTTKKMTNKKNKADAVSANAEPMAINGSGPSTSEVKADASPVDFNKVDFSTRGISPDWMKRIREKVNELALVAKPALSCAVLALDMYSKHMTSSQKVRDRIAKAMKALDALDKALDRLSIKGVTDEMSNGEIHACVKCCLEDDANLQSMVKRIRSFCESNGQGVKA